MQKDNYEYMFKRVYRRLYCEKKNFFRDDCYMEEIDKKLKILRFLKRIYKKNPRSMELLDLKYQLWKLFSEEFTW
jgi:hypothetical protein